jgi:protein-S-isoprenylcysteine O-methyltransferase Ste14
MGARLRRSTGRRWIWWREIAVRLGFFALVLLALEVMVGGHAVPKMPLYAFNTSRLSGSIGFLVCAPGVALVIWARSRLSRTGDMTVPGKETPELLTSGPYAVVRHPIYSGMLLAMVGSAIGQSLFWLLPLVVYGPGFIVSARREETLLIGQFPERYRAYMTRTRMLLPFVF